MTIITVLTINCSFPIKVRLKILLKLQNLFFYPIQNQNEQNGNCCYHFFYPEFEKN